MNDTVQCEAMDVAENTDNDSEVWSINNKHYAAIFEAETRPNSVADSIRTVMRPNSDDYIFGIATRQPSPAEPYEAETRANSAVDISAAETMLPSATNKPKMYFDWLDKATLVKIFGEFDACI